MKKLFIIFSILLSLNSFAQPGTYSGTFILDLSLYSSTVSNVDFVRGTQINSMTSIGNNQYSYNFSSFLTSPILPYNFRVNGVDESFSVLNNCLFINPTTNDTTRFINLNTTTPSTVCWELCSFCIIYGCTDSTASNFNPIATIDDTTCITCNYGCMDSLAINYDSLATCQDTSCVFPQIYGCTDSTACNFNFLANIDDSSCGYTFGCIDTLAFNYDSLSTCDDSSCIYEYNVTFQLDLRNQTSISYIIPELNGEFNNWCGDCAQMTDLNNDSIWEITIPLLEGSGPSSGPGWQYKFSADDWTIQENLFSGDTCTFTSSGYTNRFINITQDTILDPVCWESCTDCFGPQTAYNVTFQLDMTNVSGFSVPEVNGEFNGWCGSCWPMTDVNGDNIWEFTTLIDTSLQEFKFSADNWTIQEDLDSNLSCVLINYDSTALNGWGNVNRYLHINSDTILDPVCWQDCFNCFIPVSPSWDCDGQGNCYDPGTGTGVYSDSIVCIMNCQPTNLIELNNEVDYIVYPNPSTGIFYVKSSDKIDKVIVYDILNKKIFEKNDPAILQRFDISDVKSNILFLEIYINDKVRREKLITTK